jgi:hypothetical protein
MTLEQLLQSTLPPIPPEKERVKFIDPKSIKDIDAILRLSGPAPEPERVVYEGNRNVALSMRGMRYKPVGGLFR